MSQRRGVDGEKPQMVTLQPGNADGVPKVAARVPWGLIALVTLSCVAMVIITPVDYAWTQWLVLHNNGIFSNIIGRTMFERKLPGAGDIVIIAQAVIVVLFLLSWARPHAFKWLRAWRPRLGFMFFNGLVTEVYFIHSVKWIWGRFRPAAVLSGGRQFTKWFELGPQFIGDGIFHGSFPSGHASVAFSLMTLAYVLAGTGATRAQRCLGWMLGALVLANSVAVSVGRAMYGAHWLSDCVASVAFGWVTLHLLFFSGLRVPERCRLADSAGNSEPSPAWWEMLLAFNAFCVALGFWGCGIGLRALEFGRCIWLAFLIPLWLALMAFGAMRLRRLGLFAPFVEQSAVHREDVSHEQ